jgi:hypothetical protein
VTSARANNKEVAELNFTECKDRANYFATEIL